MGEHFARRLVSLFFLVAGVVAAQSARPAPAQTTPRPVQSIPAIAKAANGAIVTIITAVNDKPIAQGTGFLVRPDGVIVTNYHVIESGNVAIVKFPDGTVLPVDGVLAADKVRDLAIIKIHGKTFRTLTLGNSDQIQVGEEVVAIGNPLSLESTVSNGIVSGMRTSNEKGGKFLQTTAPISPGSSGGPLFNMLGEVVGINTMYLEGGENLNFAIPVNDAKRLLLNRPAQLQALPNEAEPEENAKRSDDVEDSASQQKACDMRAERFAGYQRQDYGKVPLKNGYVNHYDATANRCYVETAIDFGDGKDKASMGPFGLPYSGEFYAIHDAFIDGDASPIYGEFFFHQDGTVVPGGECKIYPQGGTLDNSFLPLIRCRSEEEFNDLALKYFGIAQPAKPTIPANTPKW
jgi:hypothetical protein